MSAYKSRVTVVTAQYIHRVMSFDLSMYTQTATKYMYARTNKARHNLIIMSAAKYFSRFVHMQCSAIKWLAHCRSFLRTEQRFLVCSSEIEQKISGLWAWKRRLKWNAEEITAKIQFRGMLRVYVYNGSARQRCVPMTTHTAITGLWILQNANECSTVQIISLKKQTLEICNIGQMTIWWRSGKCVQEFHTIWWKVPAFQRTNRVGDMRARERKVTTNRKYLKYVCKQCVCRAEPCNELP